MSRRTFINQANVLLRPRVVPQSKRTLIQLAFASTAGIAAVYSYSKLHHENFSVLREAFGDQILDTAHAEALNYPSLETAEPERKDPSTSLTFPSTIVPASSQERLSLVGLGVRTVSFLRVQVYVAGLYIQQDLLDRIPNLSKWKNITKSTFSDKSQADQAEQAMDELLSQGYEMAIRIVPTRNTDFGHLRDGWLRALASRLKMAEKSGSFSVAQSEQISADMDKLRGFFAKGAVPKHKSMLLIRDKSGALIIEYEGNVLGKLNSDWVSKQLFMAYLAESKNVISQKFKDSVAEGLEEIVTRNRS